MYLCTNWKSFIAGILAGFIALSGSAQVNETRYDIEDMIDDPQLGASKLAEKNAMSLHTLNRKLNTLIGLTAGDLIRQYRLQKSLTLLKAGHNVSEAASMVGFETPAYFSQCFKDHFGVSPKDYFADAK
jgi:AraC-like DNA-binding protein